MPTINLNDIIKVKLTDRGKDILRVGRGYHQGYEGGYYKFQLWEFIRVFGSHMHIGISNIIENCEIIIDD